MRWKSVIVCAITFAFLLGCVANAPIQKKGTSIRKMATFLLNFGYIELNDPDNNRGAFDLNSPEFQASIRNLQRFGNIPVTGRMDAATISLINTDRCGVKDPQNNAAVGRFKLQGSRWKKRLLTYRIVNFTKDGIPNYVQRRIFSDALRLWESAAGIEIRECSQCLYADILISFVTRKHGDYYPFDGEGGTLAHAFYPLTNKGLSGDAHFDDDERFTTGRSDGINLDWVAVHEFGHSLGLEHSNVRESIMYPWYKGYVPNIELTSDDIKGIQALYGPSSTVPPTVTTTRPPTPPAPSFCNFDESMCGFVQSKNDKFDWTRNKGGTSSSSTGPSADASGSRKGYYMYIETSSPRVQGDNAKLDSPPYRFSGNMCLKFYYHMYGATIGRLNVSINGKTVFSESDNKGNKWFYIEITISSFSGMYTVTFEGVRGSSFTGDIAIDDFSLTPGSCSPKPTVRQLTTPIRSTRRPRVTPRFTKRPRVSTSPTSHPRVTTPPVPSLCDTSIRYDTVFVGLDGWTYFFVGERFWKINRRLRRRGPRPITSQWSEIETPVDAAYVNGQRHVVFFKGSKFWEYDSKRKLLKSGPIAQYGNGGFPADSAALDNMDAVFTWEGNGRTYFFKDNQYWKYNEQTQRAYTYRYPRDIQRAWKFPGNISAAVRWLNGRNYVFWDTTYAKMDKGKVGRARGYPQLISNRWMRCNAKGRDLIVDP